MYCVQLVGQDRKRLTLVIAIMACAACLKLTIEMGLGRSWQLLEITLWRQRCTACMEKTMPHICSGELQHDSGLSSAARSRLRTRKAASHLHPLTRAPSQNLNLGGTLVVKPCAGLGQAQQVGFVTCRQAFQLLMFDDKVLFNAPATCIWPTDGAASV